MEEDSTEEEEVRLVFNKNNKIQSRELLLERTKRELNYKFLHPALCPFCQAVYVEVSGRRKRRKSLSPYLSCVAIHCVLAAASNFSSPRDAPS